MFTKLERFVLSFVNVLFTINQFYKNKKLYISVGNYTRLGILLWQEILV